MGNHCKPYFLILVAAFILQQSVSAGDRANGIYSLNVHSKHSVYDYLDRMEIRGFIQFRSNTRPLSRGEIVEYLREISEKYSQSSETFSLSDREKKILFRYKKEFDLTYTPEADDYATQLSVVKKKYPLNKLPVYGDNLNLYSITRNDFYLAVNPVLFWSFISDSTGELINHRTSGINFQAQLSTNLSCFFDYRDNLESGRGPYMPGERYKLYRDDAGYVEMKGEDYFFYEQSRAGLSAAFTKTHLSFGRDSHSWGSGKTGNLFLSDISPPIDYFSFRYEPVDFLRFTYIAGELHAYPEVYSSIDTTSQGHLRRLNESKHIAAHRLEIFPVPGIEIGLSESVIYGQRGLEPAYLNPINMYFAAEHNMGDMDNVAWGADIELNLINNISFYGELFIDDLQTGKLGTDWIGNKIGWLAGAYFVDPWVINDLDIIFEYGRLDPFVYSHIYPINTYKNWNSGLGYDLPPNSDRLKLLLKWSPLYTISGSLSASYIRHGENTSTINAGGDIDTSYNPGQINVQFLSGEKIESTIIETSIRWEPLENYFVAGSFRNHVWTGDKQNEWTLSFGVNVW